MLQNAAIRLSASTRLSKSLDLGSAESVIEKTIQYALANGSGGGQATSSYADSRPLAAVTAESLNLKTFGGARDGVGDLMAFSKLKLIIIHNTSQNDCTLLIGGEGTANAFDAPFNGDADAVITLGKGDFCILGSPTGPGWAIGASDSNLLQIENTHATLGATYDIHVVAAT